MGVFSAAAKFFSSVGKAIAKAWAGASTLGKINMILTGATLAVGVKGFLQLRNMLAKGQDIMANKTSAGGKIPVIYGTRRVGCQVVYMDTAQNRSKDLFVVYALAVGECEEIIGKSIEIDGNSILDGKIYKGGGYIGSDKITSGAGSLNTASQVGDVQYSQAGTIGTDPTKRYSFVFNLHHGAASQTADPMFRASIPNQWSTSHKLNGICYIAAAFDYDKKGMYKGVPQITVQVRGKKVYDPRESGHTFGDASTYEWSSNPALCYLDYITNDEYGKGLAESDINMSTFESAANACDTLVDQPFYNGSYQNVTWSGTSGDDFILIGDNDDWYQNKTDEIVDIRDNGGTNIFTGTGIKGVQRHEFYDDSQVNKVFIDGTLSSDYTNEAGSFRSKVKRFHCNGYIDTNKNVMDNAKELLANMRGIFTYINGKYELQIEDTGSSTFSITDDHIIGDAGISVDYGSKDKKANKVIVEFFNSQQNYELDTVTVLHDATPDYYSDDGEILEVKAEFPLITDAYIAHNMGKAILTRSRNQTSMQFLGTPEMYKLNVGDIVDLTYAGLGFSGKVCRVEALELQPNGLVSVSLIEYFDVYTWEVPAQEDTRKLLKLPTVGALHPPEASSVVFTDTDASAINRPTITWTEPTDFPVRQYRVDVVDSSDNNVLSKIVDTPSVDLSFLPKASNYEASITAFNGVGIESEAVTKTFTIADDPVKTTEIEIGGATLSTLSDYGTVSGQTGNYYKFNAEVEFGNGFILDGGTATFYNSVTFSDGWQGQGIFDIDQGALEFGSYTPSSTTNRLYNVNGTLYWNGSQVGVGAVNSVTNMVDNRVITASGSNSINGEANLTFDGTTLTVTGDQVITGNLTVQGTTTTIDTTNLDVKDKNITLNYGTGDTSANADGAGITIQDAVSATEDATILWDATNDRFDFSHGITLPDNGKAIFGDSDDLQIYHDGSNSYVQDSGTGNLELRGTNFKIGSSTGSVQFIETSSTGLWTRLKYNSSVKLQTVNTGIDVTGTVVSDGLTVAGNGSFSGTAPYIDLFESDTTNLNTRIANNVGDLRLQTVQDNGSGAVTRFLIDHATGDISFYEDTGTTVKFFWDASAETLAIGHTSPSSTYRLDVAGAIRSTGTAPSYTLQESDASNQTWLMASYGGTFAVRDTTVSGSSYPLQIQAATPNNTLFLKSDGKVGINTSSPLHPLSVNGVIHTTSNIQLNSTAKVLFGNGNQYITGTNDTSLELATGGTTSLTIDNSGNLEAEGNTTLSGDNRHIYFGGTNTFVGERSNSTHLELRGGGSTTAQTMYLDSSGRLGLGQVSPNNSIHIASSNPAIQLTDTDTNADARISASSGAGSLFIDADLNDESDFTVMSFRVDGSELGRFDSGGYFHLSEEIRFAEDSANGTNYVGLKAPSSLGVNTTYTLPSTYPANSGSVLIATTAGELSWSANTVSTFSNGAENRVITATGASGITGEVNLTYDGTTLGVVNNSAVVEIGNSTTPTANIRFKTSSVGQPTIYFNDGTDQAYIRYSHGSLNGEKLTVSSATTEFTGTISSDAITISQSGSGGSTVLLNVGNTENGQIKTRHIEGKDFDSTDDGILHLNYYGSTDISMVAGGGNVKIGSGSANEKLEVAGIVRSNGYKIGSTTVIDVGRNLTNIGTISSGAITTTGHIQQNNAYEIRSKDTGGTVRTIMRVNSSNELEYGWSGNGKVKIMGGGSYTERFSIGTDGNATFSNDVDVSGDLDVTGTISTTSFSADSLDTDTVTTNDVIYQSGSTNVATKAMRTATTTATTETAVASMSTGFTSVKFLVQITNTTNAAYHVTEITLLNDGTNQYISEYGTILTGSALATFDADKTATNLRLLATPTTTDTLEFKIMLNAIYS